MAEKETMPGRMKATVGAVLAVAALLVLAVGCGSGGGAGADVQVKSQAPSSDTWDTAGTVVVDGAGRIIAARRVASVESGTQFAVSRFTRDGRPDSSFGDGGTAVADFGSTFAAGPDEVALQQDGKILAFGWSASGQPDPVEGVGLGDLAIARYLSDGQPDPGFGTDGKVVTHLGRDFAAAGVRPDGKIVVLATEPSANDVSRADLVRYLPNGRLDPTLGRRGTVEIDAFSPQEFGLPLFGNDGRLLLAEPPGPFADWYSGTKPKAMLTGYQPDGRLDPSFAQGGKALIAGSSPCSPLAVQNDGKIFAGGGGGQGGDAFALARYTADGRLDPRSKATARSSSAVRTRRRPTATRRTTSCCSFASRPTGSSTERLAPAAKSSARARAARSLRPGHSERRQNRRRRAPIASPFGQRHTRPQPQSLYGRGQARRELRG